MAEVLNTTRLFNKSFSDFLEEVRQDYLDNKYGGELAVGTKILQSELKNYLSKITNNFEDADSVYCDINIWEVATFSFEEYQPTEHDLPIIFIISRILLEQIEKRFYDKTLENLKKDSNYKVRYFENPESYPDIETNILLESQRKGYERAIRDFNSLQLDNEKLLRIEKPQQITLPEIVLLWLQVHKYITEPKAKEKPIQWLKNKQLLRELLTHPKIKGDLSVAEVERLTPTMFVNKKGQSMKLAKNRVEPNTDSDKLKDFLTTL